MQEINNVIRIKRMSPEREIIDYTQAVDIPVIYLSEIQQKEPGLSKIYKNNSICPYCGHDLNVVLEETVDKLDDKIHSILRSCYVCGWWYLVSVCEDLGYYSGYVVPVIRKFSADKMDIPMRALELEIKKNIDILNCLHPKKLEEFVRSVFSDFFDTEVSLIGKSGDGGIDLLFCQGENPVAVQVKRRTKKNIAEGVSLIREFIGSMLLKDVKAGIFVSTADRFSNSAKDTAQLGVDKGIVQQLDLINAKAFREMFQMNSKKANYPWELVFYDYATGKYPNSQFISVTKNNSSILCNG